MNRLLRLSEFWNWLPAFRAVAETGHLPTAAEQFGVGPSALSRSITLLEQRVGKKLFDRVGRGIRLNSDGERFLAAVRASMRILDDGYQELVQPDAPDPLQLSCVGVLTYLLLPVLDEIRAAQPGFVGYLQRERPAGIATAIQSGQLDLALLPDPPRDDDLDIEELGQSTNGIYCGPTHALAGTRRPSLERILEHDFAAPVPRDVGPRADQWPPSIRRRVSMYVNDVRVAVDACVAGSVLAVLPDFIAASLPESMRLHRLPDDLVPPTTYYAVRRVRLREGQRADQVVAGIRRLLLERGTV